MRHWLPAALAAMTIAASCGDDADPQPQPPPQATGRLDVQATGEQRFPDVLDATATETAPGVWRFDVTISSPYDTPERYADAWRVVGRDADGSTVVYGVRELTHDHQDEQPFTRSLSGVQIPEGVRTVTVEGRDQEHGWGGATAEVALR